MYEWRLDGWWVLGCGGCVFLIFVWCVVEFVFEYCIYVLK